MPPIQITVELAIAIALALLLAVLWLRARIRTRQLQKQLEPIASVEHQVARLRSQLSEIERQSGETIRQLET